MEPRFTAVDEVVEAIEECENCHETACDGDCKYCSDCDEHHPAGTAWCSNCGTCEKSCDEELRCEECRGCGRRRNRDNYSWCERCECMDCCCECAHCSNCSEAVERVCRNCSYCDGCCDGCGDAPIKFRHHDTLFHTPTTFATNPLKRHISCEIEVDETGCSDSDALQRTINEWRDSVVEDGSLNQGGFEINTQPTSGDRFHEHLTEICDGLSRLNADCTAKCGLHVHVDSRDLSYYDLRRVTLLYAKVEQALFMLCDPLRLNGGYSAVCGQQLYPENTNPRLYRREIFSKVYCPPSGGVPRKGLVDLKSSRRDKHGAHNRYRALNLHSHFHRGSVEFRHHEGTVNFEDIYNWALICAYVVDYSYRHTEQDIQRLPDKAHLALKRVIPQEQWKYAAKTLHANKNNFQESTLQYFFPAESLEGTRKALALSSALDLQIQEVGDTWNNNFITEKEYDYLTAPLRRELRDLKKAYPHLHLLYANGGE